MARANRHLFALWCWVFGLLPAAIEALAGSLRGVSLAATSQPEETQAGPSVEHTVSPPFPDGPCGGKVFHIPAEDTYDTDVGLSGKKWLLPPRPISVWLPPSYHDQPEDDSRRHPVLFCHDGQNVMNDADSWTGHSWRLMGALTRLHEHNWIVDRPLPVVVLLPCASGALLPGIRRRHLEYGDADLPFAQAHADFVANTVRPLIHSLCTGTSSRPEDTAAMGSSLGGQAALQLVMRHPDKFGGAACLSPFFGRGTLQQASKLLDILKEKKIYLDIGGDLDNVHVPMFNLWDHVTVTQWWNPGYFWLDTLLQPRVRELHHILQEGGVEHAYHEIKGGRHNERAWSQRVHRPLLHLYGGIT